MDDARLDSHEEHMILPLRRKVAYAVGSFGGTMVFDIQGGYIMLFYNTILAVPSKLIGWAMLGSTLWDAATDPLMGQLSDNFRSRWGRRRPFILFSAPVFCFMLFFIFACPEGLSERGRFVYLLVFSTLFYTFSTVTMVPYGALGAELTLDYHDRTRIFAIRSAMERCGSLLIAPTWWLALNLFDTPTQGFRVITFVVACIGAVSYIAVVFGTREEAELQDRPTMQLLPGLKHVLTNVPYLLLTGAFFLLIVGFYGAFPFSNYINIYYVFGGDKAAAGTVMTAGHILMSVLSLVGVPLCGRLGVRLGKRNALMAGLAAMACAPVLSWFVFMPERPWVQLVFLAVLAPITPAVTIFPYAMLADIVDLDEMKTDRRREGVFSAFQAFVVKLGYAFSSLWVGYSLSWVGFDESLTQQAPETIRNLRLFFATVPLAFIGCAAILLAFYPLSEQRVRAMRDALETRRADRLAGTPPS